MRDWMRFLILLIGGFVGFAILDVMGELPDGYYG